MRALAVALLAFALLACADAASITGPATVHDGDDVIINDQDYRLNGIDTFEDKQQCHYAEGSLLPCGLMAKDELAMLVGTNAVTCHDTGERDGKRIIARCYIAGNNLEVAMVTLGWAFVRPDYAGERTATLCTLEAAAAQAKRGMWALQWTASDMPYFYKRAKNGNRGKGKTLAQVSCQHEFSRGFAEP